MKERPIIFSGSMVRAILEERKTQTRRIAKCAINEISGCPFGQPGDRLWVKETWAIIWTEYEPDWETQTIWDVPHMIEYKADSETKYPGGWDDDMGDDPECAKWHPSIHMPRRASRITLEITDVRIERLQGISEEDAGAEGTIGFCDALTGFHYVWDSINFKRGYGWERNPFVWAISFRR